MNKGVLWGGGLGLLLLAFLGGFWLAGSPAGSPTEPTPAPSVSPVAPPPSGAAGVAGPVSPSMSGPPPGIDGTAPATQAAPAAGQAPWAAPSAAAGPATARPTRSREERRKVREQVRALSVELQAKGANVTMQDVRTYLDKVERLGGGDFDARYFSTMRQIVDQTARAQALNQELTRLSQRNAPADVARKQAILAELRDVSGKVSSGAAALQSYSNEVAAGGKPR
ncbi:hypothetical protein [Hydrogenophaga sp. SL48]|jgi:hypothetical protein|uniref:hypothetical protein n=1 Tax=Hydrogenophaga sp. SL48 TaxID=2806347 RepID=UPI001F4740E3|nr:hypothetical protein [Hydrogenophaga sp. SL48]UJW81249.1 hypothetical protein IM738_00430 [Hydrogenophaga sp. SL48]